MIYLTNAFSLQMLTGNCEFVVKETTARIAARLLKRGKFVSTIGHADTASVVSNTLGLDIPANRASVTLSYDDIIIVAQYSGPRLPEGATTLPEGATIKWWTVRKRTLRDVERELEHVLDSYY